MHIVYIVLKKGEIEGLMEMKRDDRYLLCLSSVLFYQERKRSEEAGGRDIV
jgi:hypothetical protein